MGYYYIFGTNHDSFQTLEVQILHVVNGIWPKNNTIALEILSPYLFEGHCFYDHQFHPSNLRTILYYSNYSNYCNFHIKWNWHRRILSYPITNDISRYCSPSQVSLWAAVSPHPLLPFTCLRGSLDAFQRGAPSQFPPVLVSIPTELPWLFQPEDWYFITV